MIYHLIEYFANLTPTEKKAQGWGGVASVLLAISLMYSKKDEKVNRNNKALMLLLQNAASVCYAVQYWLLGANTAVWTNLLTLVRGIVYWRYAEKKKQTPGQWLAIYVVAIVVSGYINRKGIISSVPVIMSCVDSILLWKYKPSNYRKFNMFRALIWLWYNMCTHAYGGVLGNLIQFPVAVGTWYKNDIKRKK